LHFVSENNLSIDSPVTSVNTNNTMHTVTIEADHASSVVTDRGNLSGYLSPIPYKLSTDF